MHCELYSYTYIYIYIYIYIFVLCTPILGGATNRPWPPWCFTLAKPHAGGHIGKRNASRAHGCAPCVYSFFSCKLPPMGIHLRISCVVSTYTRVCTPSYAHVPMCSCNSTTCVHVFVHMYLTWCRCVCTHDCFWVCTRLIIFQDGRP